MVVGADEVGDGGFVFWGLLGALSLTGGRQTYFAIDLSSWLGFLGGVGRVGVGVDVDGLGGREQEEKGCILRRVWQVHLVWRVVFLFKISFGATCSKYLVSE